MLLKLFIAFTLMPVIEIWLLMKISGFIGFFNTVLLVVTTGFLGAYLARMQGMNTMVRVRLSLQQGIMPAEDLLDTLLILIAGIVLITPGLITDITGLLLLLPVPRNSFKRFLRKTFDKWIMENKINITRYP
ncbi:MAG: membrane protein FxsA [Desulfobacteraceae bacterium 4572_19]|nr:MAG: membrane protein FxsA [Desulfobacteraceae bacterium 4572_19]